jgi:hypothetical protein
MAALKKRAEEAAAKNPVLAEMRAIGQALVGDVRNRLTEGRRSEPLGAYSAQDGQIVRIEPQSSDGNTAIERVFSQLRTLAAKGEIRVAGIAILVERSLPGKETVRKRS